MTNAQLGKFGESLACRYYQRKGFTLVSRNFRFKNFEIDLVFSTGCRLVFVEVKTRSNSFYTQKELVSNKKLASLKTAIYLFLQQKRQSELENWELHLFSLSVGSKSAPQIKVLPLLQGFG